MKKKDVLKILDKFNDDDEVGISIIGKDFVAEAGCIPFLSPAFVAKLIDDRIADCRKFDEVLFSFYKPKPPLGNPSRGKPANIKKRSLSERVDYIHTTLLARITMLEKELKKLEKYVGHHVVANYKKSIFIDCEIRKLKNLKDPNGMI